jgi:hypothetical protein
MASEDAKRKPQPEVVKFPEQHGPDDAEDIESLFEPELGDAITESTMLEVPLGKPKDFFRTHPDEGFRQRAEMYVHAPEGVIDKEYYILGKKMRGRIDEARPCVLVCVIDREGNPRLWPIMLPRDTERDNDAWKSARIAAKRGIDSWVKLVWKKRSYEVRKAKPGYAPDPDWKKLPSWKELVKLAFGEFGVIRDERHKVYRDLFGEAPEMQDDDLAQDVANDDI